MHHIIAFIISKFQQIAIHKNISKHTHVHMHGYSSTNCLIIILPTLIYLITLIFTLLIFMSNRRMLNYHAKISFHDVPYLMCNLTNIFLKLLFQLACTQENSSINASSRCLHPWFMIA